LHNVPPTVLYSVAEVAAALPTMAPEHLDQVQLPVVRQVAVWLSSIRDL